MSREVRRVALDFDHPMKEVWPGRLMPESLSGIQCEVCSGRGWSSHAWNLHELWYGNVPFDPETTGSTPFTVETPEVRRFAERHVASAPEYYGTGEHAIVREAYRLAELFNGRWCHHLTQEDVDALVAGGRLMDFTHTFDAQRKGGDRWQLKDPPVTPVPDEVNRWSLSGFGHDSINASVVIRARCEKEGVSDTCAVCEGHGETEVYEGQRAEADVWEPEWPPEGEGWQLWETVSEGSPVSPVFGTAEELAQWLTTAEGGRNAGPSRKPLTISQARAFVGAGWAPTMIGTGGGLHDGAEFIGSEAAIGHLDD